MQGLGWLKDPDQTLVSASLSTCCAHGRGAARRALDLWAKGASLLGKQPPGGPRDLRASARAAERAARMSQKLRDLIRSVRACKTASDERAVIAKESALIRTAFKEENNE